MRRLFNLLGIVAMAITLISLASCSKDDDKGNNKFETPVYDKDAALFEIGTNSPYKSIELTESGNYIITKQYYYAGAKTRTSTSNILSPKFFETKATRASSNIIYGRYTKDSDGNYLLDNFGTLSIVSNDGENAQLIVKPNEGQTYELTAAVRQTSTSDMTAKLCRTWSIDKIRLRLSAGPIKFDKTEPMTKEGLVNLYKALAKEISKEAGYDVTKEMLEQAEDEFEDGEWPKEIIFTKSGTYMVKYADQSLAVSTWKWKSESKGEVYYSWDYDHIGEDSNYVTVEFSDSRLQITESNSNHEATATMTYIMSEVR